MNNWKELLEQEEDKDYYKALMTFVKSEYKNKIVFPMENNLFTCFTLTPFKEVKVVILGQDPYHDFNQAHGLAFSVLKGNKIPPSLRNIYKELNNDLKIDIPTHGDLTAWATQGVLLLNTILSVEAHIPLSHQKKGWEQFTDKVIMELNKDDSPKVFVLWGNNAYKKEILLTNIKHMIIKSSHPSPLSARHSFTGSKVFSRINNFLVKNNLTQIDFKIE